MGGLTKNHLNWIGLNGWSNLRNFMIIDWINQIHIFNWSNFWQSHSKNYFNINERFLDYLRATQTWYSCRLQCTPKIVPRLAIIRAYSTPRKNPKQAQIDHFSILNLVWNSWIQEEPSNFHSSRIAKINAHSDTKQRKHWRGHIHINLNYNHNSMNAPRPSAEIFWICCLSHCSVVGIVSFRVRILSIIIRSV